MLVYISTYILVDISGGWLYLHICISVRGHAIQTAFNAILKVGFAKICYFSVDTALTWDKPNPHSKITV